MSKQKAYTELSERYIRMCSCIDCREFNPQLFMLKSKIWKKITSTKERSKLLCLSCVIKRLGRALKISDLRKDAPINNSLIHSLSNGFGYWTNQWQ